MSWNRWFYFPFGVALVLGAVVLAVIKKGEDVVFVNRFHSAFLDNLFYYGTTLGNGLLYVGVAIALMWISFRKAVIAFLCFSVTGILVQFLKKVIFTEMMRPSIMLAGEDLHFVEGVKILSHFSFPSGHTAIAFSMFCLLSQFTRVQWLGFIFLLMALIGGVSRIYLVQHFFEDVYFGAILGVGITSLVWLWFSKKQILNSWDDKSISAYFSRA